MLSRRHHRALGAGTAHLEEGRWTVAIRVLCPLSGEARLVSEPTVRPLQLGLRDVIPGQIGWGLVLRMAKIADFEEQAFRQWRMKSRGCGQSSRLSRLNGWV